MYTLQQQYNLLPGQYAQEMATLSVLPHIRSIIKDLATYLSKAVTAAGIGKDNQEDSSKF